MERSQNNVSCAPSLSFKLKLKSSLATCFHSTRLAFPSVLVSNSLKREMSTKRFCTREENMGSCENLLNSLRTDDEGPLPALLATTIPSATTRRWRGVDCFYLSCLFPNLTDLDLTIPRMRTPWLPSSVEPLIYPSSSPYTSKRERIETTTKKKKKSIYERW